MIKEVKMFTAVCDNCGKDICEGEEYSCWNDLSMIEMIADESDWHSEDDKHYCPDCFEFDDEDNIVVNVIPSQNK